MALPKIGDHKTGHNPDDLVYGPVRSRRLGLSLGLSFSAPEAIVCKWRCPYCQLGDWPFDEHKPWPASSDILAALDRALSERERPEIITVAGGGEPTDHPDFAALSAAVRCRADQAGLQLALLTNGDGLEYPAVVEACRHYHVVQVKWDPGAAQGSWRPNSPSAEIRAQRINQVAHYSLQSMLWQGNHEAADQARYLQHLQLLKPSHIHLGTIARDPRLKKLQPLPTAQVLAWGTTVESASGIPVQVHG